MERVVQILATSITEQVNKEKFGAYINMLPGHMRSTILRYKKWQDAQASLFGKLLLLESFRYLGLSGMNLESMQYTQYRRPYINSHIDFNISHSGDYVICAIAKGMRLGIDLEEIKPLQIEDFRSQFSNAEWKFILEAEDSCREFYRQWTRKEALIKADGRGVHLPLIQISSEENISIIDNKAWYIQEIEILPKYVSHLATEHSNVTINRVDLSF